MELKGHRVSKDLAKKEHRDFKGFRVMMGHKVSRDTRVTKVSKDPFQHSQAY
jgi:hypothetical protein